MLAAQEHVAAVILAGGGGRRLGGADKALVQVAGQPLLQHVTVRLAAQVRTIVLSANGDPARFAGFGLPVVADSMLDCGPLAGIAAAAAQLAAGDRPPAYLLSIPVDTPLLPAGLAERLLAAAAKAGGRPAVAASGGRVHWTVALWPLADALHLTDAIDRQGLRRVQAALEQAGAVSVPFPEPTAFLNVNRAEDIKVLTDILTRT